MRKLLAIAAAFFLLTAWSLPEAHKFGNETAVVIGDWCSGTVVDKDKGIIVTANHCVSQLMHKGKRYGEDKEGYRAVETYTYYDPFTVTQNKFDEYGLQYSQASYDTEVLITDPLKDTALVKINTNKYDSVFLKEAKMSTKRVQYGDVVYAVGNPLMIHFTVSRGNVIHPMGSVGGDLVIVHDAMVNSGSSGGALYNEDGELIGLTNASYKPNGPAFADPIKAAIELLKKVRND